MTNADKAHYERNENLHPPKEEIKKNEDPNALQEASFSLLLVLF